MKPEELVKKTKLDRITGTRSVTRKDGYMFVELSEGDKKDLETIDNLTGKTLYIVEHGASQVMDLFEEGNSQVVIDDSTGKTGLAVNVIDISGDFMLYRVKDTNKPDTFRWWNTKVYIDAKRVDLPFLKTPTLGKESRIYMVVTEDYEIYKFPKLMYPNPIKDFFKWLKKKKKISIKVKSICDRNESFENCLGWVPKRNIKGEGEILEYIKELEGDTSWRSWCSDWANKFKNIKDITITQEDINDYISEAKNRYKIYR